MPDITMCNGNGCKSKELCYRFTAVANEYRQSYFCEPPVLEDGSCNHYSPNEMADKNKGGKPPSRSRMSIKTKD